MVTVATEPRAFSGSKADQQVAAELLLLMQSVGRFMSINVPIRLSLDSAAEFFAEKEITREALIAAISANPKTFQLDESGDVAVVVASRVGNLSAARKPDTSHDFKTRFMTPKPRTEISDSTLRPRPRMDSSWSIFDVQTTDLDAQPAANFASSFMLTQPVEEAIAEVAEEEAAERSKAPAARDPAPGTGVDKDPCPPSDAAPGRGVDVPAGESASCRRRAGAY